MISIHRTADGFYPGLFTQERFELIEAQRRRTEGVTEELKRQNPMEWVRRCNNILNRAAEIIKQELIYV